jgi:hypothetical protein
MSLANIALSASPHVSRMRNYFLLTKCKLAILSYNRDLPRTITVPILSSMDSLLAELGINISEISAEIGCDIEFEQIAFRRLPPEIYYFFSHFDSQRSSVFREALAHWKIIPKEQYDLECLDGGILRLFTNDSTLYCTYDF